MLSAQSLVSMIDLACALVHSLWAGDGQAAEDHASQAVQGPSVASSFDQRYQPHFSSCQTRGRSENNFEAVISLLFLFQLMRSVHIDNFYQTQYLSQNTLQRERNTNELEQKNKTGELCLETRNENMKDYIYSSRVSQC